MNIMAFSLLDIILLISGILLFLLAIHSAKKENFRVSTVIFLGFGGLLVVIFTLFPNILQSIGDFFGLQRGADLLVYSAIIFLVYMMLFLVKKFDEYRGKFTKMIREFSLL